MCNMVSYGIMSHYRLADEVPEEVQKALARYSPYLRQLLYTRGIADAESAAFFLQPDYDDLHDPFLLNDMRKAVYRILTALERKEEIVIYSDYDCDGIPGGVILHDFFKAISYKKVRNHIPHRHYDGFGLHTEAVRKLSKEGVTLIITVDCGSTDVEAIDTANKLGIDVVVTDHHQVKDAIPDAYAIVNPQVGDTYPFKGLCGAAVAYKLVQALIAEGDFDLKAGWEKWWLDMVGIATIADMVPLKGENRTLAFYGLQVLRKSRRPGLQQLLRKQRASQAHLTEDDIGFTIGPRINAASRMDNPEDAFYMLAETDEEKAGAHVQHLEKLNNERKGLVASMTKEVHKRMQLMLEIPSVLVLGDPQWRPSLVGLTANKLADEYQRPAFVWGRDGNGCIKGSCRSNGEVSVLALMEAVADLFEEFGGHHMAGGFGVKEEAIHALPKRIDEALQSMGEAAKIDSTYHVDYVLTLDAFSPKLLAEQQQLAPFGVANDKPLYLIREVVPYSVSLFGKAKEHTKLSFHTKGIAKEAIAFFKQPQDFSHTPAEETVCTLLAHLEQSYFMGKVQTRLRIVDILP